MNTKEKEQSKEVKPQRTPESDYGDKYRDHSLEQYKLYVEMTDRISARRATANVFFLSVNTLLLSIIGIISKIGDTPTGLDNLWFIFAAIAGVVLSLAWLEIVKSYRQLNSGKFKVIHMMEEKLPFAMYETEWQVLGEGKDPKTYRPLTAVESWVPVVFYILYVMLIVGGIIAAF